MHLAVQHRWAFLNMTSPSHPKYMPHISIEGSHHLQDGTSEGNWTWWVDEFKNQTPHELWVHSGRRGNQHSFDDHLLERRQRYHFTTILVHQLPEIPTFVHDDSCHLFFMRKEHQPSFAIARRWGNSISSLTGSMRQDMLESSAVSAFFLTCQRTSQYCLLFQRTLLKVILLNVIQGYDKISQSLKDLGVDDAICSNPTQLVIEALKRRLHFGTPFLKQFLSGGGPAWTKRKTLFHQLRQISQYPAIWSFAWSMHFVM